MQLEDALAAIDRARTQDEIVRVLRACLQSRLGGAHALAEQIRNADDIATIALELTRRRMEAMSLDPGLVWAETIFARASVRSAELLDSTGAWMSYQARAGQRNGARPPGA